MTHRYTGFLFGIIGFVLPVVADGDVCVSGTYMVKNVGCKTCPQGCYCTGNYAYANDTRYGSVECEIQRCNANTAGGAKPLKLSCSNFAEKEDNYNNSGVYTCPGPYPTSEGGAKTRSECYTMTGSFKSYSLTGKDVKTCLTGTYLPKSSDSCANCPDGFYCPGGTWTKGYVDQGIVQCKSGFVANSTHTGCVTGSSQNNNSDNSNNSNGSSASSSGKKIIDVPAGKYLPAGSAIPRQCTGANKFCPGGSFKSCSVGFSCKKTGEQGRYDCPSGLKPSADKASCVGTLTKNQMQNGISGGKGGCWKLEDVTEYESCVFGKRYEG